MKISFNTLPANLRLGYNGYSNAGYGMVKALSDLGHEVPFIDDTAPVEVAFCQPNWTEWSNPDAYHIQYTPWESTELPDGWLEAFNEADEVWTPSPLIAQWYKDAGVIVPVKVYEHGISHAWNPSKEPVQTSRFTFLHHGSAPRKGAQQAVDAFMELYGDSKDHLLILKADGSTAARLRDSVGNIVGDIYSQKNIKIIERQMPEDELINLYRSVNCFIGNSQAEGFGLPAFQAIAAGVPTICTEAWAPYSDHIIPELRLPSEMIDSPWPDIHPGKVFQPSYEDLINSMKSVEENETKFTSQARANSLGLHRKYDWKSLTEEAFAPVVSRFGDV